MCVAYCGRLSIRITKAPPLYNLTGHNWDSLLIDYNTLLLLDPGQQILCIIARSGWVKHVRNCLLQYIHVLPVEQPLGVVISSCVFWYSALATLWCERKWFLISLLCNLHAGEPSRGHQETPGTIQSPPGNNSNHLEPIRKYHEPSRAHQEMIVSI